MAGINTYEEKETIVLFSQLKYLIKRINKKGTTVYVLTRPAFRVVVGIFITVEPTNSQCYLTGPKAVLNLITQSRTPPLIKPTNPPICQN